MTQHEIIKVNELRSKCDILMSVLNTIQESIVVYDKQGKIFFQNEFSKLTDEPIVVSTTHKVAHECTLAISQPKQGDLLKNTLDMFPLSMWMFDVKGRNVFYNQRFCDMTGLELSVFCEDGWKHIVHPDDFPSFWDKWNFSFKHGQSFEAECRIFDSNEDTYLWHLCRASPMYHEGKISQWLGKFLIKPLGYIISKEH